MVNLYTAVVLSLYCAVCLIWLLGALRALYIYFRWLRAQKWYVSAPLILFANLAPIALLFRVEPLVHPGAVLETILVVLFRIGGLFMLLYLGVGGLMHGCLLCGTGQQNWRRLNPWHKLLSIGLTLELLITLTTLIVGH